MSGLGTIENEEYQTDGSWIGIVKMAAASYDELENLLGAITKGTAELKII
jgi:ribosome maturation protein Sdo1